MTKWQQENLNCAIEYLDKLKAEEERRKFMLSCLFSISQRLVIENLKALKQCDKRLKGNDYIIDNRPFDGAEGICWAMNY
jgi:hypothetical protein